MTRCCPIASFLVALVLTAPMARAEEVPSAAQALAKLKAGNARFAADQPAARDVGKARRQELAKGQKPFALILTCADSRVTPEIVFDVGLGDIFVLRVAGNVADPANIASIEYAVEHLHTPLIVVMGHEKCGAIDAAIQGNIPPGYLNKLIATVHVGADLPKDPMAALAAGVKNNVLHQTRLLSASPVLKEFAESKRVEIVPAVYSLTTGKVEWLDPKAAIKDEKPVETKSGRIEVTVPTADARLWIEGEETTSRGVNRVFKSPEVPTDRDFRYRIKAVWTEDGKERTAEKTVSFRGGKTVTIAIGK